MLPQLLRGPREPAAAHAATAAAAPGPQAAAAGLTRCLTERFHIHRVVVIAVCRSIGSRPRPDAAVAAADGGDLVGVTAAAHAEEGQAAAGVHATGTSLKLSLCSFTLMNERNSERGSLLFLRRIRIAVS